MGAAGAGGRAPGNPGQAGRRPHPAPARLRSRCGGLGAPPFPPRAAGRGGQRGAAPARTREPVGEVDGAVLGSPPFPGPWDRAALRMRAGLD